MIGPLALLLVVGAVVAAIAAWMRRRRPEQSATEAGAPPRRISLLTEAIGYIGTILVLAGAVAFAQQHWNDITEGVRLAMLAVVTVVFLGIGGLVLSSTEPALRRLAAVTWVISVAAFAGSAAMVNVLLATSGKAPFLTIATSTAVYAVVLWVLHRHGVQQAVAFGASCVGVASVVNYVITDPAGWMIVVPLWVMGNRLGSSRMVASRCPVVRRLAPRAPRGAHLASSDRPAERTPIWARDRHCHDGDDVGRRCEVHARSGDGCGGRARLRHRCCCVLLRRHAGGAGVASDRRVSHPRDGRRSGALALVRTSSVATAGTSTRVHRSYGPLARRSTAPGESDIAGDAVLSLQAERPLQADRLPLGGRRPRQLSACSRDRVRRELHDDPPPAPTLLDHLASPC